MERINIRKMLIISMMISLNIILTRLLSIEVITTRISFGFIPIIFVAIMYEPIDSALMAAISDILGMIIAPKGLFFPGFTLTAFTVAFLYSIALKNYSLKNPLQIISSIAIIKLIELLLNSFWGSYIIFNSFNKFMVFFMPMLPFRMIMVVIIFFITDKFIIRTINSYHSYDNSCYLQKLPS